MDAGHRKLIIVGAGGFSREAAEAARMSIAAGAPLVLAGFVDDDPASHGSTTDGLAVLGSIDSLGLHPGACVVIGTGRPDNYWSRLRIATRLGLAEDRYATIVHPSSFLSSSTRLGVGTVVLATVVATASVQVGNHVAIMPGVILTHDDVVADYVTITAGVRVGGGVHIGEGAYIGAGAILREGVRIGPWAMVGMASAVTRDVPAGELWLGSPARYHRQAPAPAELVADAVARSVG